MRNLGLFFFGTLLTIASAQVKCEDVEIFGRFNSSIEEFQSPGEASKLEFRSNSSRIGFRATESLGGSWKAGILLISGFDSGTGQQSSDALWGRLSVVKIWGDWGGIRMGRWTHGSHFAIADDVDFINHNTGRASDALEYYVASTGSGVVASNKIAYLFPEVGGISGELTKSFNESGKANFYDGAIKYDKDDLHLGAGFSLLGKDQMLGISAWRDYGEYMVGGYIQRAREGGVGYTVLRGSFAYRIGASELHLSHGQRLYDVSDAWSRSRQTQTLVGLNYNLSKLTKLYFFYTKVSASVHSSNGVNDQWSARGVGIRQNF